MLYNRLKLHFFLFFLVVLVSCQQEQKKQDATLIHYLNEELSKTIVLDGFSPPVASRIYAYANLAFYESLVPFSSDLTSFSNRLNELSIENQAATHSQHNYEIVGIYSFCTIAKKMVYRDYLIDSVEQQLLRTYDVSEKVLVQNKNYSTEIISGLANRMEIDKYDYTRSLGFFRPNLSSEGTWVPTPPMYSEAIEPNWSLILPFFLDSSNQFKSKDPAAFSTNEDSEFYALAMQVYESVNKLSEEELEQAKFWDCNPMVAVNSGHVMHVKRQLTPGGHWMGIAGTASKIDSLDIFQASKVYTNTAIVLADAFISCWETKYRTNLIRPETYINRYIDDSWRPILQTPMFPEFTSGHSVVSSAAAEYLTHYFGDNFHYIDSINKPFNLPTRTYNSFYQAAEEAAYSRLLGGIHYIEAIEEGKKQGYSLAKYYTQKITD